MDRFFDFVTPRLATGGALRGPEDAEWLVAEGVTHVIDCTTDSYDDTEAFALHPDLMVLWNPTRDDGTYKGPQWFAPSLQFAFMTLSQPRTKLYAHCHSGMNRGPSTAFAVMLASGFSYDLALDLIHEARPITQGHVRYAADAANALHELGFLPEMP